MKNLVYAGVIIVCLALAVFLIFFRGDRDSGIESLSNEEQVLVLCADCEASYEMGKREYYTQLREKAQQVVNPMLTPLLTCRECAKDKVTEAIKCEKCGHIFPKGIVPHDHADRCPKCKFSKIEAVRKERQAR
ncbi:MAG: hypothetical protein JSW27_07510 [Phycisphaerales bacterium]|nr:MAG: hypothetical protein JSW27_07510 [Phycisphaerales bacterium]